MYTIEKFGSEALVSNLKDGDPAPVRIATGANGQFRVVWDAIGDSTRERVIAANGAPAGEDMLRSSDRALITPLDGGGTFTLTDGGISGNYLLETSAGNRFGGTLFINSGGGLGTIRFTRITDLATDDRGGVYLLLRAQSSNPDGGPSTDVTRVVHFDAVGRQADIQIGSFASDLYTLADGHFAIVQPVGGASSVAIYDARGSVLARLAANGDAILGVAETGLDQFVVLSRGAAGLYQTLYDAQGGVLPSFPPLQVNPLPIDAPESGTITSATITSLIDGSYVVGWTQGDAYIRYFNPDGRPASAAFRVEAAGNNLEQFQLVLKANPIGGFTAVWLEGAGGGGAPSLIKSQSFVTGQVGDVSDNT